ncbi:cell division control protein 2 homolog 2-like, partial [Prosopis cineraria]|uniref:cell division control protein 2 homolog 2-like n=1 Tax=Prosopis cineraria TaxID=364024 RepID=UPI00240E9EA3
FEEIRMDNEREGFPITAIREIKILTKLHHENVKLKEIVTSPSPEIDQQGKPDHYKYKGGIYMVFEYMDHGLTGLADRPGMRFTVPQIKCYMRQLLTGLPYCHVNQVLHRDIKGSNLIDNEGNLKLVDFGLAGSFSNDHNANHLLKAPKNKPCQPQCRTLSSSPVFFLSVQPPIASDLTKLCIVRRDAADAWYRSPTHDLGPSVGPRYLINESLIFVVFEALDV